MFLLKALTAGAAVLAITVGLSSSANAVEAPASPLDVASPVILKPEDGTFTNLPNPEFSGTAAPNETLVLFSNGEAIEQFKADLGGRWTVEPELGGGTHSVHVADSKSRESSSISISIDTVAPARPLIISPANGAELITETIEVSGTGEAGATAVLTVGGSEVGRAPVDASGRWNVVAGPFENGQHQLEVRLQDAVGNVSLPASVSVSVQAATPPESETLTITSPTQGEVLTIDLPLIQGVAVPGRQVRVNIDGKPVGEVIANSAGTWQLQVSTPLREGEHVAQAEYATSSDMSRSSSATVQFRIRHASDSAPPSSPPSRGSEETTEGAKDILASPVNVPHSDTAGTVQELPATALAATGTAAATWPIVGGAIAFLAGMLAIATQAILRRRLQSAGPVPQEENRPQYSGTGPR